MTAVIQLEFTLEMPVRVCYYKAYVILPAAQFPETPTVTGQQADNNKEEDK